MTTTDRRRGLALAGLAAAAATLGAAVPALAHSELRTTSPAAGATLKSLPATVTLTFGAPLGKAGAVKVTHNRKGNLLKGVRLAPRDARRVVITLKRPGPKAQNGTYRIAWNATSADGHPEKGLLVFRVRR